MFPGPGAQVYRNEAGEPLGWDYPGDSDDPSYDDDNRHAAADAAYEDAYDNGQYDAENDEEHDDSYGVMHTYRGHLVARALQAAYDLGYQEATAALQTDDTDIELDPPDPPDPSRGVGSNQYQDKPPGYRPSR